ncbi:DNA mismatch repair protein MutS [Ammoniphilus sp. CFH 90114]|uniref:DNA mismatch repair protein MutS n=1 Tax=Ammoniphilus sp. CFH 90114 TaxID=2493665 RepID=UPI00100DA0A4|nr:DNA mismatch repair protein MutS [Ammoniphilus sp. CFH 90114]RXT15199.1 DNA mismatch repair protein MutS [Ammoniphilus sp. CFH 90114]
MAKYTPMMEQYLSIKADYPDAFLFFRLGDFYELFFDDAVLAARELEITLTGRDGGGEEKIPMCGVPYHSVDSYLQALLGKGYKIAICEQVEDPRVAKGVVRREVVRVLTPGTVMEGKMLSDRENNYLVSVWMEKGQFAMAACDISTGHFHAGSFHSSQQLIGEALSFQPKEILVYHNEEGQMLKDRFHVMGVGAIQLLKGHNEEELVRLARSQFSVELEEPLLRKNVGLLLSYLMETQKRTLGHIQTLDIYQSEQYMMLDLYSKRNLELTETLMDQSKKGSLLWYLDHTITPMGARMLRKWIDKPLANRDRIEQRLDAVEFFTQQFMLRVELRNYLKSIYDLERLAGRVSYGNANARDLANLRSSLECIPNIKGLLRGGSYLLPTGLERIVAGLDECEDIVHLIGHAIAEEPPISLKDGGLIREGYDEYLDKLKMTSRDGKKWITELEQKEREATGIKSLKIGYNKIFGYYIEVTRANLASIPSGRYERKQTLANAERFVTPELKEKEALILEAEEKLTELEYQIFVDIRNQVAVEIARLQALAREVASLDVLSSLAEVAQEHRLVRPRIADQSSIAIVEGRHPVVERVLETESFIANDTMLNDEDQRMLLITGPNMAGKSTYMRQLALIVIMAQLGSFVPANEATLSLVDRIFTRIGAADDLVGGQSTFMVEMKDIQLMTTQATKNSLVIIDEIGRGTSTHDGMSIAQAVIEFLHSEVGCKALVSTHYHELAILEDELPCLKNFHMAVQEKESNVIFLRKLKRGATDESYGIYCAKLAGLPSNIISRAQELLANYKHTPLVGSVEQAASSENLQLDLFAVHEPPKEKIDESKKKYEKIVKDLKEVDLLNMTPLQALNYLHELKQKLR